ncbi:MAG: signal recognition particle protein [Gammaproteobacteria bacterium TMED119]|nr:MAG: signal recognition particle protein [Gammaproteobacteria bacterium TMED119]RCL45240.1 MAG: signal recognition particle protein [Candidatus Thioglobus sp.]
MFDNLTKRLSDTVGKLRGQTRLTDDNIKEALREVRMALLEADVSLPVVKAFIERIRVGAVGKQVVDNITPGQALIKVVQDELVHLMGDVNEDLQLNAQPPAIILVAGLQGAGKTTTIAKLSKRLLAQDKKKISVVSCDIYRPAAIKQLQTLAEQVGVNFIPSDSSQSALHIAENAIQQAQHNHDDVLFIDTAGRLHVDGEMMTEIQQLHAAVNPVETLFVVDSMSGQDAALSAQAFNDALPLTGVILTKTDGDARGGAALSVREITGKPIKFLGTGEKIDGLEPFHPDRVASRILGMGDVVSLVEQAQQQVDQKQADKLAKKLKSGKGFSLNDLRAQLTQMQNMGGINSMLEKLPGTGGMADAMKSQANDKSITHMVAIIDSMTAKERRYPDLIKASRKQRIAAGSGMQVQDVNRLLKQHTQMSKMMKKFSKKGGMKNFMRSMQGKMPPNMPM